MICIIYSFVRSHPDSDTVNVHCCKIEVLLSQLALKVWHTVLVKISGGDIPPTESEWGGPDPPDPPSG